LDWLKKLPKYLRSIEGRIVEAETGGGGTESQLSGFVISEGRSDVDSEVLGDVDRVLWRHVDGLDVLGGVELAALWRGDYVTLLVLKISRIEIIRNWIDFQSTKLSNNLKPPSTSVFLTYSL
jgi:hypothetical protein